MGLPNDAPAVDVLESIAVSEPAGPPADFSTLYRREFHAVVALVFGLSGSRTAAEDLAQDAFAAAHRKWDRVGAYDDPGAWVRRVAMNHAVSGVRRRAAEVRALVRIGGRRELPAPLAERDAEVWKAIRALPVRQAQAVALFYVEDRTVAEIAAVLGCSEGTVKTHLYRARQSLSAALGEPEEAP